MMLLKVEYEFFDHEDASSSANELDRQIRLHFAHTPTLYVSWTWERYHGPDDEPYSIAYGPGSYFTDTPARVIDASDSPLWLGHIGRKVELAYTPSSDHKYQVLEIRSSSGHTFVYSLGNDRVGISNTSPVAGRFTADC